MNGAVNATTHGYAELEIDLQRVQTDAYPVELRFTDPEATREADRDEGEKPRARGMAPLDSRELLEFHHDPAAYGNILARQLFHDPEVRTLYLRAKTVAEARGHCLRLRLRIDPGATELHALRWELLRDPETLAALATSEKTPFSRFMTSSDWRPVKLRPKADLRALVAVAAPSNLEKYRLPDIDREGEIARARLALAGIEVDVLGREEPLTPERLVERLRAGVDILYLVCHGALIRRAARLYLQNDAGEVAVADGNQLAQRIAELPQTPLLVVLASCESAAADKPGAEAALAPRLAEAGVPAILAMQGKISMATIEKAMPAFFNELLKDGQIDRALAVARGLVRDRDDAWMPALFLRLKRGRIWYVPGFHGEEDFSKWRSITSTVRQGRFIPILGPDVAEHVFGPVRDLADRLGKLHGFPLAAHERTDLAKVTQFLSIDESPMYARDEVIKLLHQQLLKHRPDLAGNGARSLPKLLDAVVAGQDDGDPFNVLAALPGSIYVTASGDPLLLKSLKAAGREPTPLLCDWRPSLDNHPREPPYDGDPTPEAPIVYHVFGVLGKPSSLVLTEDDVFDYLLATAEYKLIPNAVRGALTRSSLLFLGFRLDDWTFRALFRLIMTLGGSDQLRDFAHVGVQIDPEEHSLTDVERACKYIESYFGTAVGAPPISIYWGGAADFLAELRRQLEADAGNEIPAVVEEDEDDWLS